MTKMMIMMVMIMKIIMKMMMMVMIMMIMLKMKMMVLKMMIVMKMKMKIITKMMMSWPEATNMFLSGLQMLHSSYKTIQQNTSIELITAVGKHCYLLTGSGTCHKMPWITKTISAI